MSETPKLALAKRDAKIKQLNGKVYVLVDISMNEVGL